MLRFRYENDELMPILEVGDLIDVDGTLLDIINGDCVCSDCYFRDKGSCTLASTCPLNVDTIFQKRAIKVKIKQDERVEQTEGVVEEEGLYFY